MSEFDNVTAPPPPLLIAAVGPELMDELMVL